jgi:hypothetical protein
MMNLQSICCCVIGSALVLIGVGLQSSSAQDEQNNPFAEPLRQPYSDAKAEYSRATVGGFSRRGPDTKSAIRKAAEELRDAEGDEVQAKAQANLRALLTNYFDEDMKRRVAELQEMETRLRKLQEQLARRQTKMQEIVELQIKVLTNEADGLGFFSSGTFNDHQPSRANYSSIIVPGEAHPAQNAPFGAPVPVMTPPSALPTPTPAAPRPTSSQLPPR